MRRIGKFAKKLLSSCFLCTVLLGGLCAGNANAADPLDGKFSVTKAYTDGKHNAFTGATYWKGKTYISFRNAHDHVSFDGQIKVIASNNTKDWEVLTTISEANMDLRDPKIVNVGDALHLYVGAVKEEDKARLYTYAKLYVSKDGKYWTERKITGLYPGSWLWFVSYDAKHEVFYGSAYCRKNAKGIIQSTLYKSKNGIDWDPFYVIQEPSSNEVSLDVGADGTLYALVRIENSPHYPVLIAFPDTNNPGLCEHQELPFTLQGPFLKCVEDGVIILGRRWDIDPKNCIFDNPDGERRIEMIKLKQKVWDKGIVGMNDLWEKPERLCTIPSGGDCSYTGCAKLPDGRTLISYYSSHEDGYPHGNIYVAIFDAGVIESK